MRILRRHKKTAVKPARGRRRTSGDAGGALSTFGGSLIALESRIMFDGAAVATASTVSTEQVAQNQAEVSLSAVDGASADTAPAGGRVLGPERPRLQAATRRHQPQRRSTCARPCPRRRGPNGGDPCRPNGHRCDPPHRRWHRGRDASRRELFDARFDQHDLR